MTLEEVPTEVQKVLMFQSLNMPVGAEMYEEFKKIIDKYPEYFIK